MRKILAIALTLALVLSVGLSMPVIAQEVSTGVTVGTGGGDPPVVKAVWQTPDDIPGPGTDVLPPGVYEGKKEVFFWAVVADVQDGGKVHSVSNRIYHPAGLPENGSLKAKLELVLQDKWGSTGIDAFKAAHAAGLVTYGVGHGYESVLEQLNQCEAEVWMKSYLLDYHQPAGLYKVEAWAVDQHSNVSAQLWDTFNYVPTAVIEIDFTSIDYGTVTISSHVWVHGDTVFETPGPVPSNKPTVRNVGNTDVKLWLHQNDMGFGKNSDDVWNVEYDARLGHAVPGDVTTIYYDPFENAELPNVLPLCNTEKINFSIHVKNAYPSEYSGTMTIWPEIEPFS